MVTQEVTINNEVGLHARPATFFIQKANEFKSGIWVEKDERRVNAKSTDCFHIGDQSCSPRGINARYRQDIRDSFLRAYVHSFSNTVIMRAVAPAHFCAKFLAAAPAALRSSGCLSHCSS